MNKSVNRVNVTVNIKGNNEPVVQNDLSLSIECLPSNELWLPEKKIFIVSSFDNSFVIEDKKEAAACIFSSK